MHSSEDEGCEHMHDVAYRHNMLKKTAILFIVKFIFKTGSNKSAAKCRYINLVYAKLCYLNRSARGKVYFFAFK